jgi:site-specific DNA-methyltransferase (adenine-specific)
MENGRKKVICGDCLTVLREGSVRDIHLSFLDPPFNQGKEYRYFDDQKKPEEYWAWLEQVLGLVHHATVEGGAVYFMQREKNVGWMLKVLAETGWTFQNLIIWKKFTSAIPSSIRFAKQHQVIVFATKGRTPVAFNKLRIDYPLLPHHKHERIAGIFVPDVWDDIRELTAGYLAGDEALRDKTGKRVHTQQSPVGLLLRIILASTRVGDLVFDPFAGSGTTLVVAHQLKRRYLGIEIDPAYVEVIERRLERIRAADDVLRYRSYYRFTADLDGIWPVASLDKYLDARGRESS